MEKGRRSHLCSKQFFSVGISCNQPLQNSFNDGRLRGTTPPRPARHSSSSSTDQKTKNEIQDFLKSMATKMKLDKAVVSALARHHLPPRKVQRNISRSIVRPQPPPPPAPSSCRTRKRLRKRKRRMRCFLHISAQYPGFHKRKGK